MPATLKIRASTLAAVWSERRPSKMGALSVVQNAMTDDLQVGSTKKKEKERKRHRSSNYLGTYLFGTSRSKEMEKSPGLNV